VTTRWLALYLRSRRVPSTAPISLATVALVTLLWSVAGDRSSVDPSVAALTLMLAVAPLITTLAGADDALEGTVALPWPPRRVLHLLGVGAFVAVLLLSARAAGVDFGPAGQIARNSAGLAGLVGLGVALFGTRLAWIAPTVWPALQVMIAVPGGSAWRQCLGWMIEPPGSGPAALTAAGLLLAGTLGYAMRAGPPPAPTQVELTP
jgi:hypothetical protein